MHIARIELEHVRSFERLIWQPPEDNLAGWHVIIGDNASGKTTFLRAVALLLLPSDDVKASRFDYSSLVSHEAKHCNISLSVISDPAADTITSENLEGLQRLPQYKYTRQFWREHKGVGGGDKGGLRDEGALGWFSASFGPMRRFSGGDKDAEKLFETRPRLAAHLSLFGEDVALTEIGRWLETLKFEQLEQDGEHPFLEHLLAFINQHDLMPHETKLTEITSKGVFFKDGRGVRVELEDLSDGFRSILCLALELVRQMSVIFGQDIFETTEDRLVIKPSGVVLIDEIDAHLHPTWQQRVGDWFVRHFPNVQFIVTTHSPLVCQAASTGSIFRLASPEESADSSRFLEGEERKRLVYGNILDAYGTEAFGQVNASSATRELREELARLNMQKNLSPEKERRRQHLKSLLPDTMTGETTDDFLGGLLDALHTTSPEGEDA